MAVKRRHRDALADLGFEVEEHFLDRDSAPVLYPEWQTVIKRDGKTVAVIATHGCHTDDDALRNKYQLRIKGKPVRLFRLKRLALHAFICSYYGISGRQT